MVISKEQHEQLTPSLALQQLKDGNQRFVQGNPISVLNSQLRKESVNGQFPRAIIISCIDSRVPVEQIFDQNIGDVFVARVAGNFINNDILGSIEYACAVVGSPLIMVLGHEGCGAVKSACDNVKLGHITSMLESLEPAINQAKNTSIEPFNSSNDSFVSSVTESNVLLSLQQIINDSPILKELYDKGQIDVCGGVYQLKSGEINWLK